MQLCFFFRKYVKHWAYGSILRVLGIEVCVWYGERQQALAVMACEAVISFIYYRQLCPSIKRVSMFSLLYCLFCDCLINKLSMVNRIDSYVLSIRKEHFKLVNPFLFNGVQILKLWLNVLIKQEGLWSHFLWILSILSYATHTSGLRTNHSPYFVSSLLQSMTHAQQLVYSCWSTSLLHSPI